jgi:pantothenate kinase
MKRAEADIKKTQLQLQRAIQLHEQEAEKKQKEKQRALQEKEFALVKYEQQDLHSRKATMESKIRQMRVCFAMSVYVSDSVSVCLPVSVRLAVHLL